MQFWFSIRALAGRFSSSGFCWLVGAAYLACAVAQFGGGQPPSSDITPPAAEWQLPGDDGSAKLTVDVVDGDASDEFGSVQLPRLESGHPRLSSLDRVASADWDDHQPSPHLRPPILV